MRETEKWHRRILAGLLVICLFLVFFAGRNRRIEDTDNTDSTAEKMAETEETKEPESAENSKDAVSLWDGSLDIKMLQYEGTSFDKFTVTVMINGKEYNGNAVVNGETQKIKDGRIRLKGSHSVQIDQIPFGSTYTVSQTKDISYDTRVNGEKGLELSGIFDGTREDQNVIFANRWKSGSLSFRGVDQTGKRIGVFRYTVKIGGAPYNGTAGLDGKTVQVEDGILQLKDGETAHITGIPFGTEYEITEQEDRGYKIVVDGLETCMDSGIISGQNPSPVIVFENSFVERQEKKLEDRKIIEENRREDSRR